MAAQYWASHSAQGLRRSRVGGLLSSMRRNGTAAWLPQPLWPSQPRPARHAGRALWAVTAPRADTAAAHRWPRWEEVAGTSKRGPQSMRRARRGRWRFGALDRCTSFAEGEEAVPVSFSAEHGCGTERRDGGGSGMGGTTRRKKGVGSPGSVAPRGGGRRGRLGGVWRRQGHATDGGRQRSSSRCEVGDEGGGGPVRRPRLGHYHGPTHAHSAAFDLKRIFKLNMI
jgi:hypothetical protein